MTARDPMCGMEITPYDVVTWQTVSGVRLSFCSDLCAERFEEWVRGCLSSAAGSSGCAPIHERAAG